MKKNNSDLSDSLELRNKAEDQLNKEATIANFRTSELDYLKIVHELQIHQIELEMQNDELVIAKEKAELAQAKYTELYDFSPSGYISITRDCKIQELNFAAARMLGNERLNLKKKRFTQYINKESYSNFNVFFQNIFNLQTKGTCEITLETEGNSSVYVNLEGSISNDNELCFLTLHDITDIKKAKIELENLNKNLKEVNSTKDLFFSIIAHDLKSPFSGFLGLLKILSEDINSLSIGELNDISKLLNKSAINIYKLLENLLEWARMQRGITPFNPEIFNLNIIVNQNIEIASEFSRTKEIYIINNINDNILVTADKPMINTVLRNLFSNAVKFTPNGGEVEIGTFIQPSQDLITSEGSIVIFIRDSGLGMSKEMINNLFRIDATHSSMGTNKELGTGLGLILCKEFITKHNGRIWVESEVGVGSTFYFTL